MISPDDLACTPEEAIAAVAAVRAERMTPPELLPVEQVEVTASDDAMAMEYLAEPVQDNCQLAYAFARYRHRLTAAPAVVGREELTRAIATVFTSMPERMAKERIWIGNLPVGELWTVAEEIARVATPSPAPVRELREAAAEVADAVAVEQEAEGEGGGREWSTARIIANRIRALPIEPASASGEVERWLGDPQRRGEIAKALRDHLEYHLSLGESAQAADAVLASLQPREREGEA